MLIVIICIYMCIYIYISASALVTWGGTKFCAKDSFARTC